MRAMARCAYVEDHARARGGSACLDMSYAQVHRDMTVMHKDIHSRALTTPCAMA